MASTGVTRIEGVDPSVAIKAPCTVATTVNITLSGAQTIDGVAVAATTVPTRALVRAQTVSSENGIYNVSGSAWSRSEDFDGNRDIVKGTLVSVTQGTVYAGVTFKVTSADPVVINTSDIDFDAANAIDVITVVGTSGIDTYAKMRALSSGFFSPGDIIKCTGDGIFGDFKIKDATVTDDGGINIPFNDDSNRFVQRIFNDKLRPEYFEAIGDDATKGVVNKAAFDAMLSYISINGGEVLLSPGVYTITGAIDPTVNGQTKGIKWVGPGSLGCELHFATYVSGQISGMELGFNASNVHLEGFTIRGAGSGVLNDLSAPLYGLNDIANSNSPGIYGKDLAFRDWSGDGANIVKYFQQRWVGCYGRDNGGWGMVLDGDQAPYFSGSSGQFFRENGTGGLWIKKGDAFVQDWNGENEDIGLKIGEDSTKRATLTLVGGNFERLNPGAIGVYISEFSQVLQCQGGNAQGPEQAGQYGQYAMYFERLNGYNNVLDFLPVWFTSSAGNGWLNGIYIAATQPNAKLISILEQDEPIATGAVGTHDAGTSATVLTDSTANFGATNLIIGLTINNTTDGSLGVITANTATTITVSALTGGSGNDWESADAYTITMPYVSGPSAAQYSRVRGNEFDSIILNGNTFNYSSPTEITVTLEGTSAAGVGTYSRQACRYEIVGKRIVFTVSVAWSAHTGTGNIQIAGMPFAALNDPDMSVTPFAVYVNNLTLPIDGHIQAYMVKNTTIISFQMVNSSTQTGISMDTSANVDLSGSYEIA